jgi:hypothetical protein
MKAANSKTNVAGMETSVADPSIVVLLVASVLDCD